MATGIVNEFDEVPCPGCLALDDGYFRFGA